MKRRQRIAAGIAATLLAVTGIGVGVAETASATVDTNYYVLYSDDTTLAASGGIGDAYIDCNSGDNAVGGGFTLNNAQDAEITASAPIRTGGSGTPAIGWNTSAINHEATSRTLVAFVVCLTEP